MSMSFVTFDTTWDQQEAMEKYAISKRELDEVVSQMEVRLSPLPFHLFSPPVPERLYSVANAYPSFPLWHTFPFYSRFEIPLLPSTISSLSPLLLLLRLLHISSNEPNNPTHIPIINPTQASPTTTSPALSLPPPHLLVNPVRPPLQSMLKIRRVLLRFEGCLGRWRRLDGVVFLFPSWFIFSLSSLAPLDWIAGFFSKASTRLREQTKPFPDHSHAHQAKRVTVPSPP
jgi:hypothetical protein